MKFFFKAMAMLAVLAVPGTLRAQTAQTVNGADERFKADILVVVAESGEAIDEVLSVRTFSCLFCRKLVGCIWIPEPSLLWPCKCPRSFRFCVLRA